MIPGFKGRLLDLSFERAVRAVEKVRERLLRSTAALDRHGVPYAVIGGNAVAAWVTLVDEDAVRNTRDVDILLNRDDLPRGVAALAEAGFEPAEAPGIMTFIERDDPSPKRGVHVIFAGERVQPGNVLPAPDLRRVSRARDGFAVMDLPSLITMTLVANRMIDKVHIRDMLDLEMITPEHEAQLPAQLRVRLEEIKLLR